MNGKKENFTLVVATVAMSMFLGVAVAFAAQAPGPAPAVPQIVPDNPMHPAPPAQPIPFSHKKHLGFGLQCKACHTNPDPGTLMTFPATSTCMSCHASIAKNKPAIQKLAEFARSQKPVPWVRIYAVLPGVSWAHRTHLRAGMKCEMCHGQVAQMEAMAETTSVKTMFSCIDCHQKNNAKTVCDTCHKN
jgi:hypothetical protein